MSLEPIKQFQLYWIVNICNYLTVGNLSALGHGRKLHHCMTPDFSKSAMLAPDQMLFQNYERQDVSFLEGWSCQLSS